MSPVLAVRLDSAGDVLLTGPAVRAMAAHADAVDVLAGPAGRAAARLLPGVRDVLELDAPWVGYRPAPVDAGAVATTVDEVRARGYSAAVVFTSFHQSALPAALLLRLAGVPFVAATSEDYPGSLLDVRHHRASGRHEVEAALDLARAAGFPLPAGEPPRLRVVARDDARGLVPEGEYVVVHPGASVPARAPRPEQARALVAALAAAGRRVVVTGGPRETATTALVAGGAAGARDLGGRTTLEELAAVLAGAAAVVVGNTAPAHLAAAVGTPVVSLFSPVVPAEQWRPWGVPHVLLGDQHAACAGSRARVCPLLPDHPCLGGVTPAEVVAAVAAVTAHEGVPA